VKESFSKAQVSLRDYLFIIFHRKKIFLLPTLIIFFTVSIGSFFLPKYYSSAVLLLIQEEKPINPLTPKLQAASRIPMTLREQLKTLNEKILNYPQLSALVTTLGLEDQAKSLVEREKLIYSIRKRTKVRLRSAEVVEIIYEDKDPKMSQTLVNTLIETFIEYNMQKKQKAALVGVEFAESQAEVYREKLESSELALYEFRKGYPLQTPGKDTDINISLLINYQTQLTEVLLSLEELMQQEAKVRNQLSGKEGIELTDEILGANPIIRSLNDDLRRAQVQLGDLLHSDPASSTITDLELEIDDLRQRLLEETEKTVDGQTSFTSPLLYSRLNQQLNELNSSKERFLSRKGELETIVLKYEQRINSLPEQDRVYAKLLRDNEVNSDIYEMLRVKVEENRLNAVEVQQMGLNYEILAKGRLPLKSSKPQKLLVSIIALIFGIVTGFGFVFLMEMGDHSFRGVEDARRFLSIPVVGSTMKIVTQEEFLETRKKQRNMIVALVLLLLLFTVIACISSYVQDRNITKRIVREEMQNNL